MEKLIWSRLKKMQCPKCNGEMSEVLNGVECQNQKCKMFISKDKFNKIVNDMYSRTPQQPERDNLSELNNL